MPIKFSVYNFPFEVADTATMLSHHWCNLLRVSIPIKIFLYRRYVWSRCYRGYNVTADGLSLKLCDSLPLAYTPSEPVAISTNCAENPIKATPPFEMREIRQHHIQSKRGARFGYLAVSHQKPQISKDMDKIIRSVENLNSHEVECHNNKYTKYVKPTS